ncbi:FG-GAP repeat domain-containing protein [Streptomyces sp. NPDC088560]|uniref:FG-GAP repeat domain-containing protein n=1 Tax=Streptomyces sp. NPDC088560 TaxID=3365868 RepID=UPI0037F40AEF
MPSQRRMSAALISAIAIAAGLTTGPAVADTSPAVTASLPQSIDIAGTPGDMTVTVTNPPATDAFIRLYFPGGTTGLTITDTNGTVMPATPVTGNTTATYVDVDQADSNNNGIPGAPLQAGDITLHIAATYPAYGAEMQAELIDGATGHTLYVATRPIPAITVNEPDLRHATEVDSNPYPLMQGQPAHYPLDVKLPMLAPPAETRTTLTFSAAQLTAGGYTAAQVAANLHAACSADGNPATACTWMQNADGSLTLSYPEAATVFPASGTAHVPLDLTLNPYYWLHAGTLAGTLTMRNADGAVLVTAPQSFQITAQIPRENLIWDLLGRDSSGVLWQYRGTGQPSALFGGREKIGAGWGQYNAITSLAGQRGDGTGDLVTRDSSGVLWLYPGSGNAAAPFKPRVRIGSGWNAYTALVGASDVTGDGHPDLLTRDHNGVLWLYQGTGNAASAFKPRVRISSGWNAYTTLIGAGDLTGDGHPDLLARDTSGVLWLYTGTGHTSPLYNQRIRIGSGWNTYSALVGVRDVTDDGHPDLLARDHNGVLWLYTGTGGPIPLFKPRTRIGSGWNEYNSLS